MATQQTLVKKITVGTPIRRVIGAQAQGLDDLTDVKIRAAQNQDLMAYNSSTDQWENTDQVDAGEF